MQNHLRCDQVRISAGRLGASVALADGAAMTFPARVRSESFEGDQLRRAGPWLAANIRLGPIVREPPAARSHLAREMSGAAARRGHLHLRTEINLGGDSPVGRLSRSTLLALWRIPVRRAQRPTPMAPQTA